VNFINQENIMEASTVTAIKEAFAGSNEGRMHFGQVVATLMQAGIESYHADYRAQRISYYLPNGETLNLDMHAPQTDIAEHFDADALVAAIRAAQRGEVMYPEFKHRSQAAGCIGYIVWISGRHVTYFGRNGETHIERFPN